MFGVKYQKAHPYAVIKPHVITLLLLSTTWRHSLIQKLMLITTKMSLMKFAE